MKAQLVFFISASALLLSVILCLYRFKAGPSHLDRVLALDLIGILAISILGLAALYFKAFLILDITVIFALVSFITALAFGDYFLTKEKKR
ncbi:monovalent cation/H+ antiporter complex subunit F [bacterium]|nr:monovalent cation/H+ antiporter complex subunit F [bacterium]